jgi:hypothetical protein
MQLYKEDANDFRGAVLRKSTTRPRGFTRLIEMDSQLFVDVPKRAICALDEYRRKNFREFRLAFVDERA